MSTYNPAIEASKDTIYIARVKRETQLFVEYEDICKQYNRSRELGDTTTDNLIELSDMCNEAYRAFKDAEILASIRFNTVYISLGGA